MKKKLIFIAPHLSTGGLPQYLYKKIENIINDYDVFLIEYSNITGGVLVVQRNRIIKIIPPSRFFSIGDDKTKILKIIEKIDPDYIHIEEMPEFFMDNSIALSIYNKDRKYKIFETSHDSSFDPDNKRFFADRFLLVSNYQIDSMRELNIPSTLVEYPIEYKKRPERNEALKKLNLDPSYKHVINVGLFTSRKNQAEIFEYAKKLLDYKIKFHFIGNQAENFKSYWEPLMEEKPDNCIVWGERNDVDKFYEMADLFLFTSRGFAGDKETSPLVIREAIGYNVPSLIYNLDVYQNMYNKYSNIKYLSDNIEENEEKILESLELKSPTIQEDSKKIVIIDVYATQKEKLDLLRNCISSIKPLGNPIMIVSHCVLPENIIETIDYYLYDADNTFNNNNVFGFKRYDGITINTNINKSHEFPIIRSIRLALGCAISLGFDFFYFTEFDHEYSINGINQIKSLEKELIDKKKDLVFFYPEEAIFGEIVGEYFESCFFLGKLQYFFEKFNLYFPNDLDIYNKYFASNFPNCLEHFFWKLFKDSNNILINKYAKEYFYDSKINISSYRSIDYKIIPEENSDHCYVVISNNDSIEYEYEIYQNNKMLDSFSLLSNFDLIPILDDGNIKIKSYLSGVLSNTTILKYDKDLINEYRNNGWITFKNLDHRKRYGNYKKKLITKKENKIKDMIKISSDYIKEENKIIFTYNENINETYCVSIKDIDSHACIYSAVFEPKPAGSSWWVIPLPTNVIVFEKNPRFGGFLIEFRDSNDILVERREIRIKEIPFKKPLMDISNTEPIFMNYEEFFIDKVYDILDMDNCKTVLDIGANVGLWTKYILSRNAKKVFSFEPNKKAIEHLKFTLKDEKNATIIEKAVYKENGTLQFFIDDNNSLTSSLLSESGHKPSYDVSAITLGEALNLTGEENIDLVKIDIEGAEFDIIENLSSNVFARINSFLIEYHDFYFSEGILKVDRMEEQLISAGYRIHRSRTPRVKYVFASKLKKSYLVNNYENFELRNIYDFSKEFSWDNMNQGIQDGYNHMLNELYFTHNDYTKGCIYERYGCIIERGDVVVDIGANIGAFSNYAYHKGSSKIFSFEPTDIAFTCLDKNKPFDTHAIKAAISDKEGIAKMYIKSVNDTMTSSMYTVGNIVNYAPMITIDSLFYSGMVDRIDFLKIDAEGSELRILNGINNDNLSNIKKIALEFHEEYLTEEDSQSIMSRLTENGFKSFQLFLTGINLRIYNFWRE